MTTPQTVLLDALTEPLAELGVDLEDVEVAKAGRRSVVRIIVDRDGGVDLDVVADVSRRVSELLDAPPLDAVVNGAYVLEVTSPGVDRPLTLTRHWRRAVDRLVRVSLVEDGEVEGRIVEVPDESRVVLDVNGDRHEVSRAEVSRAIVQVEFNRKDGEE